MLALTQDGERASPKISLSDSKGRMEEVGLKRSDRDENERGREEWCLVRGRKKRSGSSKRGAVKGEIKRKRPSEREPGPGMASKNNSLRAWGNWNPGGRGGLMKKKKRGKKREKKMWLSGGPEEIHEVVETCRQTGNKVANAGGTGGPWRRSRFFPRP